MSVWRRRNIGNQGAVYAPCSMSDSVSSPLMAMRIIAGYSIQLNLFHDVHPGKHLPEDGVLPVGTVVMDN
jgi:hypothetical protein